MKNIILLLAILIFSISIKAQDKPLRAKNVKQVTAPSNKDTTKLPISRPQNIPPGAYIPGDTTVPSLQRIDKIVLTKNYQDLELTAPLLLRQELTALRQSGIQKNWTFQVTNTGVANFKISDITGGNIPDGASVASGSTSDGVAPTMAGSSANVNMTSFDLRSLKLITPIRDQKNCGSCWSFAALASIESAHALRNKININSIDLSEQQILNCSGAGTCKGGNLYKVLNYLTGTNLSYEAMHNYQAKDMGCNPQPLTEYKIEKWGWIGADKSKPTIMEIKNAIVKYGAISSWLWVNRSFQLYASGVINDGTGTKEEKEKGGHFVQIIGWNDNLNAWLIKNSWGSINWGMAGFGWIDYNVLSIGAFATWVVANPIGLPTQSSWRFCQKCYTMHFEGAPQKGICSAGNEHTAAGYTFVIPYDIKGNVNNQVDWRYCSKCSSLFYDGYTNKGVCKAGGGHQAAGYNFVLTHDITNNGKSQKNWRYCNKCQVLFFDGYPQKGSCTAGGGHQAAGYNFVVPVK